MASRATEGPALTDPDDDVDPLPGEGDPVATGAKGGGEWPSPATPPADTAPGTDPDRRAALEAERTGQARQEEEGGGAAALHPPAHLDRPPEPPPGGDPADGLPAT